MLRVTKEVVQVLVVVIPGAITHNTNNTFQRTWIAFFFEDVEGNSNTNSNS